MTFVLHALCILVNPKYCVFIDSKVSFAMLKKKDSEPPPNGLLCLMLTLIILPPIQRCFYFANYFSSGWVLFVLEKYCISTGCHGIPLQHSCLESPMDGGAWWAAVHGVAKSRIRLSDFTFTFHFHALEKEMATHSSVLAWRIPGMGCRVGCHLWGHTESDTTEATQQQQQPGVS